MVSRPDCKDGLSFGLLKVHAAQHLLYVHPMGLGDPKECRERAAYCRAATSSSPIAREKFAHMAQVWLHLAIQLEEQWPPK
jgi:hypothetical protein